MFLMKQYFYFDTGFLTNKISKLWLLALLYEPGQVRNVRQISINLHLYSACNSKSNI